LTTTGVRLFACSISKKLWPVFAFRGRVAPAGFNFPIPQSADLAGAEACRYSENRRNIFDPP
jgi:hypothetical protein